MNRPFVSSGIVVGYRACHYAAYEPMLFFQHRCVRGAGSGAFQFGPPNASRRRRSAIRAISEMKPGLVFLDVQMPEINGFKVLEAIAPVCLPGIVFVTAYDRYALKAFDAEAIDYLLKPFRQERFYTCLERAKNRILNGTIHGEGGELLSLLRSINAERGRLIIRNKGKIIFLRAIDVEWAEAAANYVRLYTAGRCYNMREGIGDLERQLPPDKFVRIHRSVIVNVHAVAEIQGCGPGEYVVVMRDGKELPVGRSYRDHLVKFIKNSRW